jgi:RHS repeat-associated protein
VWAWQLGDEAFGDSAPNQDPDNNGTAFVFDLRFPGQRYDSASGLSYNYFRDYESGSGRYAQSDPIGLEGGISTYSYVKGNPLLYQDPTGLNPAAAAGAVVLRVYVGLAARCEAIYQSYKALQGLCRGCDSHCDFNFSSANCACWTTVVQLRKTYVRMKCDYILFGIHGGGNPRKAERGHKRQIFEASAARNKCCARAAQSFMEDVF